MFQIYIVFIPNITFMKYLQTEGVLARVRQEEKTLSE